MVFGLIHRFQEFLTGITVCYKYIQRIKNMEMTEFGLKGIHVSCLFYLHNHPDGLTAAQLCQLCAEDKATISRTVADLRAKGYILNGGEKLYRAPLCLSPTGQEVARKMEPVILSWVAVGGDGLTEEQRTAFYDSLKLISANLHNKIDSF